jgi:hypothetical protein
MSGQYTNHTKTYATSASTKKWNQLNSQCEGTFIIFYREYAFPI